MECVQNNLNRTNVVNEIEFCSIICHHLKRVKRSVSLVWQLNQLKNVSNWKNDVDNGVPLLPHRFECELRELLPS